MKKKLLACLLALVCSLGFAQSAWACGGLLSVTPVYLNETNIMAAWHEGHEYYMTNFRYSGQSSQLGWIVPLPSNPEKIVEGDSATFQNLYQLGNPVTNTQSWKDVGSGNTSAAPGVQVLQQTQIGALDIRIVQGSGTEIVDWGNENGFQIDQHSRVHLLGYARGTSIFMAAKYNGAVTESKQAINQSTPVLLVLPTPQIWVPIEILAFPEQSVSVNLYLLTDAPLYLNDWDAKLGISAVDKAITNAPGATVKTQKQLNDREVSSLADDKNMEWVRPDTWFTYVRIFAPESQVTYDLTLGSTHVLHLAAYGTSPENVIAASKSQELPTWLPDLLPGSMISISLVLLVSLSVLLFFWLRRRRWKRIASSR